MAPRTFNTVPKNAAWVTLITKASYVTPALVLYETMKETQTKYPLIAMVTPALDSESRRILTSRGIPLREIEPMRPKEGTHKLAEHDKRFEDTWTKLRAFDLVEYDRVVLVDSDMIFRRNADELMSLDLREDGIAAAHACTCNPRKLPHYPKDWIPANCGYTPMVHPECLTNAADPNAPGAPRGWTLLNSGLVVLNPSLSLSVGINEFLLTSPLVPSFSFPDQDFLAAYFKGRWDSLPYIYNALKPLRYIHAPLWRDEEVKVLHLILMKPWESKVPENPLDATTHGWWWDEYEKLRAEMEGADRSGWEFLQQYISKD